MKSLSLQGIHNADRSAYHATAHGISLASNSSDRNVRPNSAAVIKLYGGYGSVLRGGSTASTTGVMFANTNSATIPLRKKRVRNCNRSNSTRKNAAPYTNINGTNAAKKFRRGTPATHNHTAQPIIPQKHNHLNLTASSSRHRCNSETRKNTIT